MVRLRRSKDLAARVIAVDVLPAPRFAQTNRYDRIAHRIVLVQRRDGFAPSRRVV
jgi:hypothetical protein